MSETVKVRMYNVGFGDCFLLTLPGKQTILVDAGFHSQGKGAFGGNDLAKQIKADLIDIKGEARIDVVIATHRHQDHVYAFNSNNFDEIEVGEVWLPWVEDRSNPDATRLWKKQQSFAMQLAAAAPLLGLSDDDQKSVNFMLWNAGVKKDDLIGFVAGDEDLVGFDAGGWSNAGALNRLHEGFLRRDRARPRFLPETHVFPESFESPALSSVKIHVLGPPRDAKLIEELDPETDGESYRALALQAASGVGAGINFASGSAPFAKAWQVPYDDKDAVFPLEADEIERMIALTRNANAVFAAEKVDGMINSTSLVLVLEIGKARLLLPGDAEWGTWKRILDDDEARTLVRSSTFFKVGHHGSHNATSKTLVEKVLSKGIPAMISTQEGEGNYRNNIPLPDLLTALHVREIQVARSDHGTNALPAGFTTDQESKWIDLELPC